MRPGTFARVHQSADTAFQWKGRRSHRVDDQEFYQLLDKDGITDDIHLFNEKLRGWEDYQLPPPNGL